MSRKNRKLQQILYINICCVIIVLFVVGIFLLKEHPTMAVEEIPQQIFVTTIAVAKDPFRPIGNEYGNDFILHGILDTTIPVYCFDGPKDPMNNDMTIDELLKDPGIVYIVENGYPHKQLVTREDFPNVSELQLNAYNYFITQWAIWTYKHRHNGDDLPHSNDNNTESMLLTKYGIFSHKLSELLSGAENRRNNPKLTDITFKDDIMLNVVENRFETSIISFKSATANRTLENGNYQLEITAPAGYYIVTNDGTVIEGNQVNSKIYKLNQGFKIVVPTNNINETNLNISIKVKTKFEPHFLRLYNSGIEMVQRGLLSKLYVEEVKKTIDTKIAIPTGKLKVAKTTINEQGQTEYVTGATLKIESSNDSNFAPVTFQTTNTPREFTGLIPGKTYTVTEVEAPSGFIHNQASKSYTLTAQDSYTNGDNVATITLQNEYTKICIKKVDKDNQNVIIPNATYDLVEKSTGNVVRTWQTTTGPTCFTRLPLGTYQLVERVAPTDQGYIVVPPKDIIIGGSGTTQNFTSEEDYTKICIKKVDKDNPNIVIPNARLQLINKQTGVVYKSFTTTTNETCYDHVPVGAYRIVELEAPLAAGYVISPSKDIVVEAVAQRQNYTFEDDYTKICIKKVDKDNHNLMVPNAKIQLVSKQTGAVYKSFTTTSNQTCYTHVPVGEYKLVEIEAPIAAGYVISPSKDIVVEAKAERQNYIMEDDYTKICIKKVDKDNPNIVIPNARLQLVSKQTGAIYKSFTTTTKETCYDHVPVGEYKLVEIEAPLAAGYVTSPSKNIMVEETAEKQNYTFEDDYTKVCIAKVDKYDHTKYVADAKVKLVNKLTGEVVKSFTTTTTPQCYNRLPGGTYKLIETEAPTWEGYVKAAERDITIIDTKEVQTFQFEDDYTKLCIKKVDKDDNLKPVVGARMHLFDKKTGKLIKSFTTREEETCFYKLPVGEYELMEEEAPGDLGYVKMENKDIILRDTEEKQLFMVDDDYTKLCIKKINPETEELIEGAHLLLTGPNGYKQEIITSKEQEEVCYDHIPVGDYKLEEIKTPPGYITSPTKTFKINDGNRNLIVMDDLLTRVKITKLDGATGKPLSGVELGLIDSKGQEVRTWFSTEEAYEIVGLPIGKYTLIEKSPLEGYVKIADYEFEIHDRVETVIINVTNDRKVEVPDTASNKNILTILFGLLFISGGGILLKMMYQNKIRV